MNTEVARGLSCEVNGEGNSELPAPIMTFYTGEVVHSIWGEVGGLLEKAARWGQGQYTVGDILVLAFLEKMQIWVIRQGDKVLMAAATRVIEHPRKKVCEIYALAGCRAAEFWGMFSPVLLNWCDANGIADIEATCRPEVAEKIQKLGFKPTVQVLQFQRKEMV